MQHRRLSFALPCLLALAALACLWAGCVKNAEPSAANNRSTNQPAARLPVNTVSRLPETAAELAVEAEGIITRRACRSCHRPDHATEAETSAIMAPPLARIAERRPGDWLRRFLRYPYKLRPHQAERMPQLGLSDFEVEVLARYMEWLARERIALLPAEGPAREANPRHPRILTGRRLFVKYNCMNCHSLGLHQIRIQRDEQGNVVFQHGALQAPDLSNVWQRVRPQWLVAMIKHPPDWMPWSRMPELNVTEQDVQDLAWYLMNAVASPVAQATAADTNALLQEHCTGCHDGDNPARGLDLSSLAGLRQGVLDDFGTHYPVVVPFAENSPLLGRLVFGDADHRLTPQELDRLKEWILAGAPGLSE